MGKEGEEYQPPWPSGPYTDRENMNSSHTELPFKPECSWEWSMRSVEQNSEEIICNSRKGEVTQDVDLQLSCF